MQSLEALNEAAAPAVVETHRDARYVGSELFRRPAFGGNHPLNIVRHSAVLDLVGILGWLEPGEFCNIQPASLERLLEFHDPAYVEALQYADTEGRVSPADRERFNIGTLENPLFAGVFDRAAMTVGGSIAAAELALAGHIGFHPSGGTHHGRPDRASGFCYFNDPVFAIRTLLAGGRERVLYVDLDAHHGDGVEDAFADDPRVMTISVHEKDRWPNSGVASTGSARNIPVPAGLNDSELDYIIDVAVLELAERHRTDALVVCCGADSLGGDPLSNMMLSNVALWAAVERLRALTHTNVVLGGGGYNPWTLTRYWAGLWGRLSGRDIPESLPADAVTLMRGMECDLIDDEDVDERWLTTMADTPYPGPVRDAVKSSVAAATD